MAKAKSKTKAKTKKPMNRKMKRNMRWTIAALFMLTAVVIALIPVQNGGVSAIATTADIPALADLIADGGSYRVFTDSELSVVPIGMPYRAFPLMQASEWDAKPFDPDDSVTTDMNGIKVLHMQESNVDEKYTYSYTKKDGTTIPLGEIDNTKGLFIMSAILPSNELKKDIYSIASLNGATAPDTIVKYTGRANSYPAPGGTVPMSEGSVGYVPADDEFRIIKVKKEVQDYDSNNNPLGTYHEVYSHEYNVCTNAANIVYIADDAFSKVNVGEATNIVNITLPSTLDKIGNRAFKEQLYLRSINGGYYLTQIGKEAFSGCGLGEGVTFDDACPISLLGDGAFANTNLSTFIFPTNTQKIGSGLFYNCPNLNDSPNPVETIDSSIMFSKTKYAPPVDIQMGSYVFAYDTSLTNIALDNKISKIGNGTEDGIFAGCTALSTVVLPEKFTGPSAKLTDYAFIDVHDLNYIRTPDINTTGTYDTTTYIPPGGTSATIPLFISKINQKQNAVDPDDESTYPPITQNNYLCALWGPKPSVTSAVHEYAQQYGIPYMYVGDDGLIHYELTLNGYTFEFDDTGTIISCVATKFAKNELAIPDKIGDVPIVNIKENAFKDFVSYTGIPVTSISIPDSVKTIGAHAFDNCAEIETVKISTSGVDIGDSAFANNSKLKQVLFTQTTASGDSTIGDNCFKNDPVLELVSFRATDLSLDNINVVNVAHIGNDAFKTGNDKGLTMRGKMDPSYAPYAFALNLEEGSDNRTSTGLDAYITYETGNPENLVCRYDGINKCVQLKSYPCADTIVSDPGKPAVTIHELEEKMATYIEDNSKPQPTVMEDEVLKAYKNITIPEGIDTIKTASAKNGAADQQMLKNLNEPDGSQYDVNGTMKDCNNNHALTNLVIGSVNDIPDYSVENCKHLQSVTIDGDVDHFGKGVFREDTALNTVTINGDVKERDLNSDTFYKCSSLSHVSFNGEGAKEDATPANPYYWCEGGIIYKYDGDKTVLVECLPGVEGTVTGREDVDEILPSAFEQCDKVQTVDLSKCSKLKEIPERCFYDCDVLATVILPEKCATIGEKAFAIGTVDNPTPPPDKKPNPIPATTLLDVYMHAHEIYVSTNSFENRVDPTFDETHRKNNTVHSYDESAAGKYSKKMPNVNFVGDIHDDIEFTFVYYKDNDIVVEKINVPYDLYPDLFAPTELEGRDGYRFVKWDQVLIRPSYEYTNTTIKAEYEPTNEVTATFVDWDGQTLGTDKVLSGQTPKAPKTPSRPGYDFTGWTPKLGGITENTTYEAQYEKTSTSGGGGGSSGGSSSGTGSSSGSSSSSNRNGAGAGSSGSSALRNSPVVVSGAPAPYAGGSSASGAGSTSGSGTGGDGTNNNVKTGNADTVSTANGLDGSKLSATVNGSSDNYIIKITETNEADEMAKQALSNEFGSLDNIRYFPYDISLYDSTGSQKISPVPEGISVSVTMPIPDDLTVYGGNNKVGSTLGGTLEKIQPRFTVIDGVPCMNYTVTHLSPYVVYVDTTNLTAGGVADSTPKTADPIHPKWFLVIGFAAISIFLFLKRDKATVPVKAA